jgi:hypothetical protein
MRLRLQMARARLSKPAAGRVFSDAAVSGRIRMSRTACSCRYDYGQSRLMKAIGVTFASGGHDVKEPNGP